MRRHVIDIHISATGLRASCGAARLDKGRYQHTTVAGGIFVQSVAVVAQVNRGGVDRRCIVDARDSHMDGARACIGVVDGNAPAVRVCGRATAVVEDELNVAGGGVGIGVVGVDKGDRTGQCLYGGGTGVGIESNNEISAVGTGAPNGADGSAVVADSCTRACNAAQRRNGQLVCAMRGSIRQLYCQTASREIEVGGRVAVAGLVNVGKAHIRCQYHGTAVLDKGLGPAKAVDGGCCVDTDQIDEQGRSRLGHAAGVRNLVAEAVLIWIGGISHWF